MLSHIKTNKKKDSKRKSLLLGIIFREEISLFSIVKGLQPWKLQLMYPKTMDLPLSETSS